MSRLLRLLFILIVACVVFVIFNLNPLIKRSVETVGPMVLDVPVTLGKSDLSFLGSGELKVKVNIEANLASKSAINKVEKIGGSIQLKK